MLLLVPFRGQKKLEPYPFYYLCRGQNENSRQASPSFLYGSPPPQGWPRQKFIVGGGGGGGVEGRGGEGEGVKCIAIIAWVNF